MIFALMDRLVPRHYFLRAVELKGNSARRETKKINAKTKRSAIKKKKKYKSVYVYIL